MIKSPGFTLIEVLVSVLVLAVGLLGLAGLQAASLKNNQSAYNRSQATQLAYDIADRMRANVSGKAAYTVILPSSATAKTNCLATTGCTPAEMAENDLFEWNRSVSNNLPSGIGMLAVSANIYTISINWDDDRDENDTNNPDFQTRFQL
jgi:type IV pilus assembly protein PilV